MPLVRWISLIVCVAALVAVILANVRGFRMKDATEIRRSARWAGWLVLSGFILAVAIYAIALVRYDFAVAAAFREDKAPVLVATLDEPVSYFRWSLAALLAALIGVAVLRGRASYLSD